MKQVVTPVISNQEVMPNCYLMWLESAEKAAEARPGQFIMVRCGEDTLLPRPFSIHQREGGKIALLFRVVGKGTDWLSQRISNETVELFGPLGNGFSINPESKTLLLVAGGIGVAPLHFLFKESGKQNKHISLIMGADTQNYLYTSHGADYTIVDNEEFTYTTIEITNDGSKGRKGMATDLIATYVDTADQVFACGPLPMYRTMAQMPELKGKSVQVSLEVRMGCGVGVCYGCTVRTKNGLKQVCLDGPVFNLDDILWDELAGI